MPTAILKPISDGGTNSGWANQTYPAAGCYDNLWQSVDEGVDTPNDSDYIGTPTSWSVFLRLGNLPADAIRVQSVTVKIRSTFTDSRTQAYCQVLAYGDSTCLANSASLFSVGQNQFSNQSVPLENVYERNPAAWSGARIEIRPIDYGSGNYAVSAIQVEVVYETGHGEVTSRVALGGVAVKKISSGRAVAGGVAFGGTAIAGHALSAEATSRVSIGGAAGETITASRVSTGRIAVGGFAEKAGSLVALGISGLSLRGVGIGAGPTESGARLAFGGQAVAIVTRMALGTGVVRVGSTATAAYTRRGSVLSGVVLSGATARGLRPAFADAASGVLLGAAGVRQRVLLRSAASGVRLRGQATATALQYCRSAIRSVYRVFAPPAYRFYGSKDVPPAEGSTPFATAAELPATIQLPDVPVGMSIDGTWYVSVSYFNGVLDSGFLAIGSDGATWRRIDIQGGQQIRVPPTAPTDLAIVEIPGGGARLLGTYDDSGDLRANEWAIAYTLDGTVPAESNPGVTLPIQESGGASLYFPIGTSGGTVTIRARVQVRRNDGTADSPLRVYSAGSEALSLTIGIPITGQPLAADDVPVE